MQIVTADLALLDAALEGDAALARALGCRVAGGWNVFAEALPQTRDAVAADPGSARWGTRLILADDPRTVVGWGGFKGPPREGVVEIGYAVAPSWEGRGIATEAAGEMVREAFAEPEVTAVIAHTEAKPGPSARVLEKNGFVRDGEFPEESVGLAWRFRLDRSRAA